MKQIIKFLKKMSVENALFFFSMFGVAMMAFAFMGGNMRFLDEGLAIWLIIAGAVLAGVIEPPSASPVILEDDVLIGANAVVIEGVHIGKGAVVGAGSIVTQDVPAGAVVVGNPARIIKEQKDEKTEGKTQLMDDLRKI